MEIEIYYQVYLPEAASLLSPELMSMNGLTAGDFAVAPNPSPSPSPSPSPIPIPDTLPPRPGVYAPFAPKKNALLLLPPLPPLPPPSHRRCCYCCWSYH